MARLRNRKGQALRFFTNGKRADDVYGLFDHVGRVVRRTEEAAKKARVSTSRRAESFAKEEIQKDFNIRSGLLSGKFRVVDSGDAIRLFASQRRVPLLEFGGRWGGRKTPGATAEIERGNRETFASSFIATVKGKRAVRVRKKVGDKRVRRGPLKMLYGPSPKDMVTGQRSDPETRNPEGRYPRDLRKRLIARLAAFHIAELRRLYEVESRRG